MRNPISILVGSLILLFAQATMGGEAPPPDFECGDCFTPHNTPGCTKPACEERVCSEDEDPFCCGAFGGTWDSACVGRAFDLCTETDCEVLACDLDDSGSVDTNDFGGVADCWGHVVDPESPDPCDIADVTGDGIVNILDFSRCVNESSPPLT